MSIQSGSPTSATRPRHAPVVALSDVLDDLDRLAGAQPGRSISLAEIEDSLKGRGVALLIVLLSLPFIVPVPIPLLSTVCGVPMIMLGLTILVTGRGILPAFARRRQFTPEALSAIARSARRFLKPIAWAFRPRVGIMFWAVPWRLTGLSIVLAALVLSLPLPVPFANMIPALGLLHLALGVLQRDGIAIAVGHAFTVGAFAYLYFVWDTVVSVISAMLS